MPRIRTIKPEFWQNESLAGLSHHARLLAIALLNHADDKGYFIASHQLVRAACFPFEEDSKNVLGSIQELSRIGYIEIRNCDGKQIGRICKFLDHQRIDKPQKSKLFEVFAANHEQNGNSKNVLGTFVEDSKNAPRPERKGKEGEGEMEGEMEGDSCPQPDKQADGPETKEFDPTSCRFPVFPCSGQSNQNRTWQASPDQIDGWRNAYPNVNIDEHHRRAHAWIMANLGKRKTRNGMPKFLNGWFAKQQDRGGGAIASKTFGQQKLENTMEVVRAWKPPAMELINEPRK
jgi:hypothetical protein